LTEALTPSRRHPVSHHKLTNTRLYLDDLDDGARPDVLVVVLEPALVGSQGNLGANHAVTLHQGGLNQVYTGGTCHPVDL